MKTLTHAASAEYFQRSYTAVDGLWFMKLEAEHGFEAALKVDHEVWKVLPKIQARKLRSLLEAGPGLDGLHDCLTTKFRLEAYTYVARRDQDGFSVAIRDCPWRKLMVKSGREHLADKISRTICHTEYCVWAAEFGDIRFELVRGCQDSEGCLLRFAARKPYQSQNDTSRHS